MEKDRKLLGGREAQQLHKSATALTSMKYFQWSIKGSGKLFILSLCVPPFITTWKKNHQAAEMMKDVLCVC